jgi:predicted MPP superfamily phosphohydrolase
LPRLIAFAVIQWLAWLVARRLRPSLGRGWMGVVVVLSALVALAGWAVPLLLGRSIYGRVGFADGPWRLFSAAWFVGSFGLVVLGGGWLSAARLLRLVRRRLPGAVDGGDAPVDPARRRLLTGVGQALPLAAMGTGGLGVASGVREFVVRREEVRVPGLPERLDGFRIGQLTDVHVGAFVTPEDLARAVRVLDGEGVHLQVMTGDLIDDLEQLPGTMDALGSNVAPHGMVAVLGNHEHFRGVGPVLEAYARLSPERVRLLVDGSHTLHHEGEPLRVVGVDYPLPMGFRARRELSMAMSAERAFREVAGEPFTLCLSHHPDFFPHADRHGAHLTLSGHTHGGQVAVLGLPLLGFAFDHVLGRYRRGDRHLYVSGGTGHWLPFRVGVPAEVTVLTLRRA